jgi:hypothetical protein
MQAFVDNPGNVRTADIIVGIPSYNEADSIAVPTDTASRGLETYFPHASSVIINYLWKYVGESRASSIYGFGQGMDQTPPPVEVSTDKLFASFRDGWATYADLWRDINPPADFREIEALAAVDSEGSLSYASSLWARIVFNFAVAYKRADETAREKIMDALIPFYHSRVLSFINTTRNFDAREAEEYLEQIQRVFEGEKYYLIERWDRAESADGRLFE